MGSPPGFVLWTKRLWRFALGLKTSEAKGVYISGPEIMDPIGAFCGNRIAEIAAASATATVSRESIDRPDRCIVHSVNKARQKQAAPGMLQTPCCSGLAIE